MEVIKLKNNIDLSEIENNFNEKQQSEDSPNEIPEDIPEDIHTYIPYIPTPILTPGEAREKRKTIIHIKNYIREFPDCLDEFKDINFTEKSQNELNNYLEEIRLTVCNSNNSDIFVGLFHGGCDVLEKSGHYIGYDLTGLSTIASKNKNVIKCVKEISLEYQQLNYIKPEKRLMLMMISLCYGVNYMNKMDKNVKLDAEKDIDNNLNKKYSDL